MEKGGKCGTHSCLRQFTQNKHLMRYAGGTGKTAEMFSILPPTFALPKDYIVFLDTYDRVCMRNLMEFFHVVGNYPYHTRGR